GCMADRGARCAREGRHQLCPAADGRTVVAHRLREQAEGRRLHGGGAAGAGRDAGRRRQRHGTGRGGQRHALIAALARSSAATSSAPRSNCIAPSSSCSCGTLVALAIGAVTDGRAISQASATCAGVALCVAAMSSSTASTARPCGLRKRFAAPPRALLLARSAALRYLPLRKPLASA